jgi:hypothetical protein
VQIAFSKEMQRVNGKTKNARIKEQGENGKIKERKVEGNINNGLQLSRECKEKRSATT